MKLTEEEKQLLINAKDESSWYAICDDIKARRNGIYPNYLSIILHSIYFIRIVIPTRAHH